MKKHLFRILVAMMAIWAAIGTTGCKNENKDMLPGEVRLKENDYRNDDKVKDIIIKTENNFEKKGENERNLYESPIHAEEAFDSILHESMNTIAEKYPQSHASIMEELARADVHTYIKYVWCAQAEEYVNLKFEARPHTVAAEVSEEQK